MLSGEPQGAPVVNQGYMVSRVINTAMITAAVIACFMQIPIDDTTDNIVSAVLALISSVIALLYLRHSDAFETHPISTFAIFGFCATSVFGALLVQSFSLTSLSKDLRQPLETFLVLGAFQIVAIGAHITYRMFNRSGRSQQSELGIRPILSKLGVYVIPTAAQLWMLGMIGIVSILTSGNIDSNTSQTIFKKIAVGISFLAWSPFLIPIFVTQIGKAYCNVRFHLFYLVLFTIFIALLGIAANARYMIVSGVTTLTFITLLMAMRSKKMVGVREICKVFIILILLLSTLFPISQLATAMVVVRQSSSHAAGYGVLLATIDVLQRPGLIEAQRKKDKLASFISSYDEIYIQNPLLARFVLTKYHDNALFFESKLSDRATSELADTTLNLFWTLLPDPVLKYFDIAIVKKQYVYSMGDYLYHQATGGSLGGFKIGSIFGQGIGLFGWFFSIVYFGICLVSFWVLDFLATKNNKGEAIISVVGILLIWRLYMYGINAESINNTIGFIFREIPQSIVIFLIFYRIAGLGAYLLNFTKTKKRLRN